jgi:hypothetical protein
MFTRKIGGKRKMFHVAGGVERHDSVIYYGRELKGFIRVRNVRGQKTEETCFLHQKTRTMLTVPGVDYFWLAERNSIIMKKAA